MKLSEEDLAIRARARTLADELMPFEVEAEMAGGRLPPEIEERHRARAGELGLTAISAPKGLGGRGFTVLQQVLAQEQIGRVTNALGWVVTTPATWLPKVATEHQMETWVLPTIRGERHECYAITEEGAGSDVDAIEARARHDGDDYVLNGVKWHVTSFNVADHVFFQAKLDGGPNEGAHAMFIVDSDTPGVRVVRTPRYSHSYPDEHPIVAFEDVRVPTANLIGEEGDGMSFTHEWFRYERLMIAARCCGAADRLIEEAEGFSRERMAFGKPIGEYQGVAFPLADSIVELWGARLMTYRTAREMDEGADVKLLHAHCSMAKLYASEMANRVADRAVQIFGGRGYMRENVAERFFRELRVDRIWEGTSEVQRAIIADQLGKRGTGIAEA
ncbi:MAG TPA: acyl-CoA dehydrogenase family protein [Actinomycetota bacterium]|nr:acyl-CoA dehydrogenase family protein [Actinomycetota bacterium]